MENRNRVIAEYIGWEFKLLNDKYKCVEFYSDGEHVFTEDEKYIDGFVKAMKFDTSFDKLIPVAKKVLREVAKLKSKLDSKIDKQKMFIGTDAPTEIEINAGSIGDANRNISYAAMSFDITKLHEAVYNAILLINKFKKDGK